MEKPDSRFYTQVLTQEGFLRWAQGIPLTILDVKPEFRKALAGNFIERPDQPAGWGREG